MTPLRALPRLFVEGATADSPIDLPKEEIDKLRRVLRLGAGAEIAILPNDGSILRCRFEGKQAMAIGREFPETEAPFKIRIAQSWPKGDKAEEIIRACTEIGVAEFVFFTSERTVVRWDEAKVEHKLTRFRVIARESAELSFRTRLPLISAAEGLAQVLAADSIVLSEAEGVAKGLPRQFGAEATVVVGPEGGWSPRELELIGSRGVTLGPRVLRAEHAAAAAAAALLMPRS